MNPEELRAALAGLSEDEQRELLEAMDESQLDQYLAATAPVEENGFLAGAKDIGMGALKVGGKVLDYAGGVARTGGAAALMDNVGAGDVLDALRANPLSGSEILERGGMPEAGKFSDLVPQLYNDTGEGLALQKGGWADPTGRGAAGMALEIATDPLTYFTLGGTKAVGKGVETAGKASYRSGLKRADRALELVGKGKQGFSETAMKYGLTGSAEEIADQASALASKLAKEQDEILAQASKMGATVDVDKVIKPVITDAEKIQKGINIPQVKTEAKNMQSQLMQLADETRVIPEQVIQPEAVQAPLFNAGDLPQPVQKTQLATNADEALRGQSQIPQQVVMPEGAMAAQGQQDILEMLTQGQAGNASTKYTDIPDLLAQKGANTGPAQQALLSDAATLAQKQGAPNVYQEIKTVGEIAPGQTSLLTPLEGVPTPKAKVIPGRSAPSVADASRLKSQVYNQIGDAGFSTLTRDKTGQKLFKRTANRLRIGVEQGVTKADAQLGQRLKEVNKDLGNLLSSKKVLANEASKEISKNALTSVDGLLAVMNPAAAVSKKTTDILKSTAARTKGGKKMMEFGQYLKNKETNPYQFLLKEAARNQGDNE